MNKWMRKVLAAPPPKMCGCGHWSLYHNPACRQCFCKALHKEVQTP